jgi:hypothetical protein
MNGYYVTIESSKAVRFDSFNEAMKYFDLYHYRSAKRIDEISDKNPYGKCIMESKNGILHNGSIYCSI